MKKVFLSTQTGHLAVGIPFIFFEEDHCWDLDIVNSYRVVALKDDPKPVGYAMFVDGACHGIFFNEQIAELPLEDLGEL